MKNLLYFIANTKYRDILQYNIDQIKKISNNNFDICCITDKTFTLENNTYPIHIHSIDAFDYRYSAKFEVDTWPYWSQYDNFLYLDTDCIVVKNINHIFEVIENSPDVIHGVREKDNLNNSNHVYYRFTNTIYPHNPECFNAGTFGFSRKMLPLLQEFKKFIAYHKSNAHIDQALYNEFFAGQKNIVQSTLTPFVNLYNPNNDHGRDINNVTILDACIIHFLGNMYNGKPIEHMDAIIASVK